MSTNNPSLVVQRLDRATDLVVSAGLPVKCLVFPATGGLQAIDAAGNILPLVGPSGSLIPSADNVDDLGSLALRWHSGFFGGSVMTPNLTALQGGVEQPVAALVGTASTVNYLQFTSAATGNAPSIAATGANTNIALALRPAGTNAALSFIDLQDGASISIARCFRSSTPVNYVALRSSNNGSAVGIGAGSDTSTDVAVSIRGLGNGQIQIDGQTGTGGVSIGVNASSRIGFYATTPIVRQTGVPISAAGIHTALVNLGLITA